MVWLNKDIQIEFSFLWKKFLCMNVALDGSILIHLLDLSLSSFFHFI